MVKNTENISLASLLGVTETEDVEIIEEPPKEGDQQVRVDYLTTIEGLVGPKMALNIVTTLDLNKLYAEKPKESSKNGNLEVPIDYINTIKDLVSPKTAFDIVTKYSRDELVKMEVKYDRFEFNHQPKTVKGKLERVLKFLEWEKDLPSVGDISSDIKIITESFGILEKLVQKIIALDNPKIKNKDDLFCYNFVKVTGQLLECYGVDLTSENKKTGHAGREYSFEDIKVVPGITTNEIIDFLIKKEIAGQRVNEDAIIGGFDNAHVAMEVASMAENDSDAIKYVINGFTSMGQVSTVSLEKLKTLARVFGFSEEERDRYYYDDDNIINKENLVGRCIGGEPGRVDELIAIGENRGGNYLVAFDGNLNQTQEILKIAPKKRPSIESVKYARTVLKEQKDLIALAKEIDSPYKEVFEKEFKTKEEFLDFKKDYKATINKFIKNSGKEANVDGHVSGFYYKRVKSFEGNWKFFRYLNDVGTIEAIEKLMDLDTYKREIIANKIDPNYAIDMLGVVNFKEKKIPYAMLIGLQSNGFKPQEVKAFIGMEGVKKYQQIEEGDQMVTKPIFKANDMITDLKEYYKKEQKKKD